MIRIVYELYKTLPLYTIIYPIPYIIPGSIYESVEIKYNNFRINGLWSLFAK